MIVMLDGDEAPPGDISPEYNEEVQSMELEGLL